MINQYFKLTTMFKKSANLLMVFLIVHSINMFGQEPSNLKYVDPTIGGVGIILQPTRPTVHLPNSLIRVHPIRNDQLDDEIDNFPLTVTSHRLYQVFSLMPLSDLTDNYWDKKSEYRHESVTPYHYNVTFEYSGINLEFTPHERSGIFKMDFAKNNEKHLRLGTFNSNGEIKIDDKNTVSGFEEFAGMKAYFYAEVNTEIKEINYRGSADKNRIVLTFKDDNQPVLFKYAISYISTEQAKQNLEKEIQDWDFNAIKEHAFKVWDEKMSQIQLEGGTEAQKRVFYTALYRSYERMVNINEYGQYYSAYDNSVHVSDEPFYVDNWIWDNYIALEPLHIILNPKRNLQQIKSYVEMYRQSGYIPSFSTVFGDWPAMTGNFAAAWFADAWFKGLKDFDIETAYQGLKKNSLDATLIPWRNGPKTSLDTFYNEHGYMPGLPPGQKEWVSEVDTVWEKRQSVSVTTANSFSDWCIAQIAAELDKSEDVKLFRNRAGFYKNVYRTEKGFMWPKDKEGNWIEPFDPRFAGREYFTENNAYNFNWDVKHDLFGLFDLMGGKEKAEKKLDELFRTDLGLPKFKYWYTQPDASGLVGQFVMGNEPGFHIPYLYNYLGAPWKTQKRIRMLLDAFFTDNIHGIPGDEDGGGMSAFVVFSMMGFFPVTPGIPVYTLGSPVFEKATINLPNRKIFTITAKNASEKNVYIQKAFLNGKPLTKTWFEHSDILNGGKLEFVMGNIPNKAWGTDPEDAPPSSLEYRVGENY